MDYYAQPEDEVILSVFLDDEDFADLEAHLADQAVFKKVSVRGIALDHALDPHAVVQAIRHSQLALEIATDAMELGKDAMHVAVGVLVANWVKDRNQKKADKINSKEVEPLLFDQYGHRLDIRPESKKRKKG
jgi:hypothetical protein